MYFVLEVAAEDGNIEKANANCPYRNHKNVLFEFM
jgi:hypothetical protein